MALNIEPFTAIEAPFEHRNQCWFCGEPKGAMFNFPRHIVFNCIHPNISVPACSECHAFANKTELESIWQVLASVKGSLFQRYKKDLAIGINWTEQELKESQFEGGNFESFQKSAWFMFEVAKQRVNFKSWKLVVSGIYASSFDSEQTFSFDGVVYPSVEHAINQYCEAFKLNKSFLRQILAIVGQEDFAFAVRYCRILIDATPNEQRSALNELRKSK